ncbi:MAG: CBASS cGAMP-activated phospholipase [Sporomusaceae bacterium]|nr:CBASS cGAMP-activated phospholipase [Sporomusaceae bacterium]
MKKILSIDGGGVKGTLPASFLAHVEEHLDGSVAEYFDLIVGTSTGGIIALGLGLGMTAKEILGLYAELGPKVFRRNGGKLARIAKMISKPMYEDVPLKEALEPHFGGRRLGESRNRLVIPAFDFDSCDAYLYKTAHHKRLMNDYKAPAMDVALATSAAPMFFPAHRNCHSVPLVDGGVWCNNPVLVAAMEGADVLSWDPSEIRILSLGCSQAPLDWSTPGKTPEGMADWVKSLLIVELFYQAQSAAAMNMATLRLGGDQSRIYRINPVVAPDAYSLDGIDGIDSLKGKGYVIARKEFRHLKDTFFSAKAEPFTPEYVLCG